MSTDILTAASISTETGIPVRAVQRIAKKLKLGKAAGERLRIYTRSDLRKIVAKYTGIPGNPDIAEQAKAGAAARWKKNKKKGGLPIDA